MTRCTWLLTRGDMMHAAAYSCCISASHGAFGCLHMLHHMVHSAAYSCCITWCMRLLTHAASHGAFGCLLMLHHMVHTAAYSCCITLCIRLLTHAASHGAYGCCPLSFPHSIWVAQMGGSLPWPWPPPEPCCLAPPSPQMSELPFEVIEKLRHDGQGLSGRAACVAAHQAKEQQKGLKRLNRHRPSELSSKRPVPRFREVLQVANRCAGSGRG